MLHEICPFILTQAENPNSKNEVWIVEIPDGYISVSYRSEAPLNSTICHSGHFYLMCALYSASVTTRGIYELETHQCIALSANCVPVNCTPGRRCVSLLVKPSRWNVTSRRCTSPLCSICFASELVGTQFAVSCVSSLYIPLRLQPKP